MKLGASGEIETGVMLSDLRCFSYSMSRVDSTVLYATNSDGAGSSSIWRNSPWTAGVLSRKTSKS